MSCATRQRPNVSRCIGAPLGRLSRSFRMISYGARRAVQLADGTGGTGIYVADNMGVFMDGRKCIGYTVYHWVKGDIVAFTELHVNPFRPDAPISGRFRCKGWKFEDAVFRHDIPSKDDGIEWGCECLEELGP